MTEGTAYFRGEPVVTKRRGLSCQVCVPADWSDKQINAFAERENPCGTELGWVIRREGNPILEGDPERAPCSARPGFVHVTLDA